MTDPSNSVLRNLSAHLRPASPAPQTASAGAASARRGIVQRRRPRHNATAAAEEKPLFVVFITGAGSGIGLACAQRFDADGATVIGTDLAEDPPADFVSTYNTQAIPKDVAERWRVWLQPGDWVGPCDVRDEEAQLSVVDSIIEHYGQIDALVTAAGVATSSPVHTTDVKEWQAVHDVNLMGTMITCKCVVPHMIERRHGSIITVGTRNPHHNLISRDIFEELLLCFILKMMEFILKMMDYCYGLSLLFIIGLLKHDNP